MTSFRLDSNNNIIFDNNNFLVSGNDAVVQDVKNILLMFKTENPFDLNEGIDYYALAGQNNKNAIENAIIERILEDSRIKSVNLIDVYFINKEMQVQLELLLQNGDTINV